MFFDDDEEKKLFEDIQFKRKVAFVDDDDIFSLELKSFSKTSEIVDVQDSSCQVNIQNEPVSSSAQTRSKKSKDVQTDFDDMSELDPDRIDMRRLAHLFDKRTRLVEDAIYENNQTAAFLNYDVDWSTGGTTITNPFILINKQLLKEEELQVTCVQWNSSGSTIFVAYGRLDHESVCTHKAALSTWNVDRLKLDPNKPDVSIDANCCISTIEAHPEYPAIVAVGFFNGEIHVYDIRQSEPLVASVTDKRELHRDEVTTLKWIRDPKSSKKKYLLLSGSKDGKILFWNALPSKNQLKLLEGFIMLIDNMPKSQFKSLGTEMAVSSIALNKENKETFMVGCESGGLFKCSFLGKNLPNSVEFKNWQEEFPIDLLSPVELAYDPQHGPIYSISHSPFHRNLILTCGTDSEIKLYSLLQTGSLMNFCPENGYLYSVEWSPFRPCVFACGSHKGNLLIYDLNETGENHCQVKQASDSPINTISFNQQRAEYLATGDRLGVVKIWRLSQALTKFDSAEINKLNDISEKPFKNN